MVKSSEVGRAALLGAASGKAITPLGLWTRGSIHLEFILFWEPQKFNPFNCPLISSKYFHYLVYLLATYTLILHLIPCCCTKLIDFMLNALLLYKAN